ncbi:MAG: SDR family NAD(P)-dependent oxidoreductase [Deltaproteobacteria bacterium]
MKENGRVALITGAGQGMGLGVARRLAADGIQVCLNDIDPQRAASAAEEICSAGGQAIAAPFDVTCLDAVLEATRDLEARLGHIDILVNNAGNAGAATMSQLSFKDMPASEWSRYLDVNLYGVLHCTKAVLDGMCERGWGRVVTISSEAGRTGLDIGVSLYGVAKAGAAHLMRHLAREVGPSGVTTNVISLGLMDNVPPEFTEAIVRTIPARRLGSPQDVGAATAYLVSEDASWVTGQTIVLNGGSFTH